jgi:serine/threonine-protein kinase
LLVSFKGSHGSFDKYSYFDVITDKIPLSIFENKVVLVNVSAVGIEKTLRTPTDPAMPQGEFLANAIWTMLNRAYIKQPQWGRNAELIMILVIGGVITFALPRLGPVIAGMSFLALFIVLLGGSTFAFVSKGLWIKVTYPLLQLVLGYTGVVILNHFAPKPYYEKVDVESSEADKIMGISFQNQGMLDMAFDKFRRLPVEGEMKEILYNLGLAYERKRQLDKAAAVYEFIGEHDKKFKDVRERKKMLMRSSETVVIGDGAQGSGSPGDGLDTVRTGPRSNIGRYEVIRELGRGSMGIVYLGQDPRINRTTAIKAIRFADDFEPEEAEKIKETFFREAESVGTLSHSNIVTIYDAGEEEGLAYIAMEYLEGQSLKTYTNKDSLLPMRKIIDYVADIADALDYAHQKGIVHRDIKPANIMLTNTGVVKITDFGIARIMATSETQTGVVKGTPHYMSPEQFSGEKVDGRSDIFSLGTMLFELLTGRLPFEGDSPLALMHQIMDEPHPDPREYNPRIVTPLVSIINKTLEKDRDKRYQKASLVASHLRTLGKRIDEIIAEKKGNKTTK